MYTCMRVSEHVSVCVRMCVCECMHRGLGVCVVRIPERSKVKLYSQVTHF